MQILKHCQYLLLVMLLLLLCSCGDNEYLVQSIKGHFDLMSRARPIDHILDQKSESADVHEQLQTVMKLREFAVESLHLPDSGSYKKYADLERPYAVWNIVAAPELSLGLYEWCFPVIGCVTYRGYYDETSARTAAGFLADQGFDVDVYGVQAYSTLNWFADPVLNTFLDRDEIRMAALLFHEMAHQVVYVPNDSLFNESFAKAVEMEGLRRWFSQHASPDLWTESLRREKHATEFQQFLSRVSQNLEDAYSAQLTNDEKRVKKAAIIHQAYADYEVLKDKWGGFAGYDAWMESGLNNARLASVATYNDYVPAFNELLRQVDYSLPKFYARVKAIAKMTEEERKSKMAALSLTVKASSDQ